MMKQRAGVANSWRVGPDGVSWGRSMLNIEIATNLSAFAGPEGGRGAAPGEGHWNNPGLLISTKMNSDGSYSRRVSEKQR